MNGENMKTGKSYFRSTAFKNVILIGIVIALALFPLATLKDAEFGGADSGARDEIEKTGYKPWAESLWSPPSGEIEGLLFALQAAIGSGIMFYCLGYMKGRKPSEEERKN